MTRTDKVLIGTILTVALLAMLVLSFLSFPSFLSATRGDADRDIKGGPKKATVKVHGQIVNTLELSEDSGSSTFEVEGPLGVSVVQVQGNRVRIVSSPCPDKICVNQGWIQDPGAVVICVPNEISVSVEGDDGVDAILR